MIVQVSTALYSFSIDSSVASNDRFNFRGNPCGIFVITDYYFAGDTLGEVMYR